jgi:type-F conjugative transfer system pilin assembly protein TrbC
MSGFCFQVAALVLAITPAFAQEQTQPDPAALAKQATERARAMNVPKMSTPVLTDEQRKAIETSADSARNAARAQLSKLAEEHPFTPAPANKDAPPSDNLAVPAPRELAGRVVVALSSSMPESEWREYMAQLDGKPEAIVVLRGFVGGATTVEPTGKLIERAARKIADNPKGGRRKLEVVVDPILFKSLGIDRVPAVAWLPGVNEVSHCDGKVFETAVTVYGTASVSYALQQINRNGGNVPAEVIKSFGG